MVPTIEIFGRQPLTLAEALEDEDNVVKLESYVAATQNMYRDIWERRHSVEALVRHHMNLGRQYTCTVLPPKHWIRGSFNIDSQDIWEKKDWSCGCLTKLGFEAVAKNYTEGQIAASFLQFKPAYLS